VSRIRGPHDSRHFFCELNRHPGRGPLIHRCIHAIPFISAFGLYFPSRRRSGLGGQPRVHRREPGRRIWRRPMPGQGRQMRRARRPFLLPVAEFHGSNSLPTGRTRRDNRFRSQDRRKLHPCRLHRIRRHYLPALAVAPSTAGRRQAGAPRQTVRRRPKWPGQGSRHEAERCRAACQKIMYNNELKRDAGPA
jgi:hypothetical protein